MADQNSDKKPSDAHQHEHHHHKPSLHGLIDELKPIKPSEVEHEKAKERPFEDLSKQHKIHHLDQKEGKQ